MEPAKQDGEPLISHAAEKEAGPERFPRETGGKRWHRRVGGGRRCKHMLLLEFGAPFTVRFRSQLYQAHGRFILRPIREFLCFSFRFLFCLINYYYLVSLV